MTKKNNSVEDVLRKAIKDCGLTSSAVARKCGLQANSLYIFMEGGGITLRSGPIRWRSAVVSG